MITKHIDSINWGDDGKLTIVAKTFYNEYEQVYDELKDGYVENLISSIQLGSVIYYFENVTTQEAYDSIVGDVISGKIQ